MEALQSRLGLVVDGIFGRHTEYAVRSLQHHTGCAVDGIVGPETRAALEVWQSDPLMGRAIDYRGWGYAVMGGGRSRFARPANLIPREYVPQVTAGIWDPHAYAVDCITFATGIVALLFPDLLQPEHYTQMMLWKGEGPWANVRTLVDTGCAVEVTDPGPGWHYWQGWRRYPQSGHCGLAYGDPDGCVQVLESAQRWGPSWRWRGPLRSLVRPIGGGVWPQVEDEFRYGLRVCRLNL